MPTTYETLSQGGHEAMTTEIFTKIKSYLDTHGVDSKVDKSGDTMTGSLVFKNVNNAIQYTGSQATYPMIKFIDNTGDVYGNGISIGGGGTTIIGGGESSDAMASSLSGGGSELMYIGNDGDVNIFSNLQNGWSSRRTFTFDTNGSLVFDANVAANVIVPSRSLSYIAGAKGNAGLYAKKVYNADAWYPAVCLQTKGGGSWQMGNYNNEYLEFVYATKANIDANKNETTIINLKNTSGTIALTSDLTWGNISGKPSSFTPSSHNHDDRYYTESEINTKIPNGYRLRAGTKVVTVTNAQATVVFTQSQIDSIVGVSGCTGTNTVVYVANGDYGAQSHYISACIYNNSNKTWCMASVYNGAFAAGNFRANYIIIRFG